MAQVFMNSDEVGTENTWLVDLLVEGIAEVIPLLAEMPHNYVLFQLVLHPHDGEAFFLLAEPDGPYILLSPVTPDAEAFLHAQVPGAKPARPSGTVAWANRQAWQPVIGLYIERIGESGWRSYDPRGKH